MAITSTDIRHVTANAHTMNLLLSTTLSTLLCFVFVVMWASHITHVLQSA